MKGCPLRCLWCSNPESQKSFPEVAHRNSLCTRCGRCLDVCDVGAISLSAKGVRIRRRICTNCGKCADVCPSGALTILGKSMSVEDVLEEVKKDELFYRNSLGGVTISGGEPLFQLDFAVTLLKRCQQIGLHTTIDTCGYIKPWMMEQALQYADLVLYDLKHGDPIIHHRITGVPNQLILNNAKMIAAKGIPMIIRIPYTPGINDEEENTKAIALFALSLQQVPTINFLPYHRFGVGKYQMLDKPYKLSKVLPPSNEDIRRAKEIIQSYGLDCECVQ